MLFSMLAMHLMLAVSLAQSNATSDEPLPGQVICKFIQEQRTLTIKSINEERGCELEYVKYGTAEIVASSQNGHEICLNVQQKIRQKLESVGFNCRP